MAMRTTRRLQVVTPQTEAILKSVYFYRYVTAMDIAYLHYSPSSFTYVRERLHDLCGGNDNVANEWLYRFPLPTGKGNRPRVFTLGSRGRAYLADELGMPARWYFRPHKMQNMGYNQVLHNITLTRFLVAAHRWCAKATEYELSQTRICYELADKPAIVTITLEGQRRSLKVIPDAWLEVRRTADGKRFHILLEIDRGMHFQKAFKEQVRSRIAYLDYGLYEETFGAKGALIAYANTGPTQAVAEGRRETLRSWTNEVLAELQIPEWAAVFRFHALALDEMYEGAFFEKPVWYRPDRRSPSPLFR